MFSVLSGIGARVGAQRNEGRLSYIYRWSFGCQFWKTTLAALIVVVLFSSLFRLSQAADQKTFVVHDLSVEGWILGTLTGDFSGDNLRDIAIIYLPTPAQGQRRYLGLFIQSSNGVFPARPSSVSPLPATAVHFQATDVNSDGVDEVLFIDDLGVQMMSWSADGGLGQPVRLARRETIYQAGVFQGALLSPFALELNGLPGKELIIPIADGVAVFERDNKGVFSLLNEMSVRSFGDHVNQSSRFFGRNRRRAYRIEVPQMHALDANLDGRTDLYLLWTRRASLFLQDESGNFSNSPDHSADFSSLTERATCFSQLIDCNGDNRPDAVVMKLRGGITAAECQVDIYLADQSGFLSERPDGALKLSQARATVLVTDINGDRLPELILPAVELGTASSVKMIMQKRGGLYLLAYKMLGGKPDPEAFFRKKFSFSLDYDLEAPDAEILFDWSSDYNNDGFKDLVFSNGANTLEFYYGSRRGDLPDNPSLEVPLANVVSLSPLDLNRDGKSDLLAERANSGRINGVWVLMTTSAP